MNNGQRKIKCKNKTTGGKTKTSRYVSCKHITVKDQYQGINNYLTANRNIGFFSLTTSLIASALGAWILFGPASAASCEGSKILDTAHVSTHDTSSHMCTQCRVECGYGDMPSCKLT